MNKSNLAIILFGLLSIMGFLAIACNAPISLSMTQSSSTPIITHTATPTARPTPTATPTPVPTPVPAARIDSAELALFYGDWDRALNEFQSALESSPEVEIRSAALLGIGRTYHLMGNAYEAVRVLEALIQEYPESAHLSQAYFILAQAQTALEHHAEAGQAYSSYLNLRPGLIDGYVYDLRGDASFAAGDYSGAISDYRAALTYPSLLDSTYTELKTARAMALMGDFESALALYDDISQRTANDNTRALISLRKGQIFQQLGQYELANEVFLQAVNNYPTAYESYSALVTLVENGIPVDELQRGIVDYYAGEYGVALAAFDRYLQNNPLDPGSAYYFSGLTQRASGGYQAAVNTWERLIQNHPDHTYWDEAWEQKAYTQWAYLDQYTLAIQTLLDFVQQIPTHARAAEFLFDAAEIAELDGRLEQAAELWERAANTYPLYEESHRALFLAGITQYRMGNYINSLRLFQQLAPMSTNLGERAATFLWIGKNQMALGDESAARASWEQAANLDPTGYYSERARDLLRNRDPFAPPMHYDMAIDQETERARAETWLRTTFGLPDDFQFSGLGSLASDARLIRGMELWEVGLYSQARNEFEQLRQSVQSDPVTTYQLANFFRDIGLYRSTILAARQVLDLAGMDDATTLFAPAYFNYQRFGTYYSDLIMPLAENYNFHPLFLFSVIRQESLFESFIRSSASASGLMQIIPSTGADIARNLGWPVNYTQNDLYRPLVSLRFGTDYLDTQRKQFDGDLIAALAAYNGGPGNAREWKKLAPNDLDLFLEVIRYNETQDYIRRIYEIFNLYRLLYDRTP